MVGDICFAGTIYVHFPLSWKNHWKKKKKLFYLITYHMILWHISILMWVGSSTPIHKAQELTEWFEEYENQHL